MTPRFPRLDRPPIVEALIDFGAQFPEALTSSSLAVAPETVLGEGATSAPLRNFQAEIFFSSDEHSGVSTGSGLIGYRFQNAAGDRVVQFRADGMTYSMVGSYTTWEDLEREAVAAFQIYQQAVGESVPIRPAARFINRIEIPLDVPLDRFLRVAPPVPAGIAVGITAFHAQTHFRDEGTGLAAVLTLAAAETADDAGSGTVTLDVSVRSENAFAFGLDEEIPESLVGELQRIRDTKNAVFFGSLTSQTLALYQGTP